MTTLDRLRDWKNAGTITDECHRVLAAMVGGERFSVFLELNALLYLGVLSLVGGLGWTFRTYVSDIGDVLILATLSLLVAGSLAYCFSRAAPFSREEVESPTAIFDYVLYFGCLTLSVELAYVEVRFELLQAAWDQYLLASAVVFMGLAYRFDNRLVLSLALSSLAGWFGLRVSALGGISLDSLRLSALVYGAVVATAGAVLHRQQIKPHLLETYLHIAAHVAFAALVTGIGGPFGTIFLVMLMLLAAVAIERGVRSSRFAFVAYGVVYGYVGVSVQVLDGAESVSGVLAYLAMTGTAVIVLLAVLARRFGREE